VLAAPLLRPDFVRQSSGWEGSPIDEHADRHLSDRELRALSTADLLSLIQRDITELDTLIGRRRPPAQEPPLGPFHAVTCCNRYMGDFPPFARVRCPFCGTWLCAGSFPR
jgi:hypothetical protein